MAEVILQGYEEYKENIINKLRGMFSFVIWDIKEKELFAVRDNFGIKPFYYTTMTDTFMFGSEIKSFLYHPDFNKEINKEALKPYLTFQYSALDETFFKGVYRLKPGHYLKIKNNKIETNKYFEFEFKPEEMDFDQMKDEIHKVVTESIDIYKKSEVPSGAYLSGGIDSSYVVSYFKPEKTFSIGFDYENFNEVEDAKALSKILKINNINTLISGDQFFEAIPKVQYHFDEPAANLSAVPLYYLSQLASKSVKVVLSGEGADELYGGYTFYRDADSLEKYRKLPWFVRSSLRKMVKKLPDFKGKNFLIKGGSKVEDYYIGNAFVFENEEASDILTNEYNNPTTYQQITKPIFDKVKDKDDVTKKQYLDLHFWMPNDILLKADKMSMANSIELRAPFLDKEVFKQALTVPTKYKIKNGTTKYILRQAAHKIVPEEWAKRPKKGFPVPIYTWLKEEKYYSQFKEVFLSEYTKEFFDQDKIMKLLNDHYYGKKNNCRKVWTIYAFLIWYQEYFINN